MYFDLIPFKVGRELFSNLPLEARKSKLEDMVRHFLWILVNSKILPTFRKVFFVLVAALCVKGHKEGYSVIEVIRL